MALHLAFELEYLPAVAKLLEMGFDTDLVDYNRLSPIYTAVKFDHEILILQTRSCLSNRVLMNKKIDLEYIQLITKF